MFRTAPFPPLRAGPYLLEYKRDYTRCVLRPGTYLYKRRWRRLREQRRIQQKRAEEALPLFLFVTVAAVIIQLIRYLL